MSEAYLYFSLYYNKLYMNSIFSLSNLDIKSIFSYIEQQPGFDGGAFSGSIFIGFTYVIMACGFALELIYDREVCK